MTTLDDVTTRLTAAGFIAAREEAQELCDCSNGDEPRLASLVQRRLRGEPLAWITGSVTFCGLRIRVDPRVYVPRFQSEPLVRLAVTRLPSRGSALDLCTGSGAIARTLLFERPEARVVASDLDERAVACAVSNGVSAYQGDLFEPFARELEGEIDVVVAVVPYVPTPSLALLARDTFVFESSLSYDGGTDGADILRRVVAESPRFLRPGGALLLEVGGEQSEVLRGHLARCGFVDVNTLTDEEGDVRGVEATLRK